MAERAAKSSDSLVCPHCGKEFEAELLLGETSSGFKCPHCRLFVPLERAGDPDDT
jgi:DNA-directed RNA polymerase subunit RPC12/RpoP